MYIGRDIFVKITRKNQSFQLQGKPVHAKKLGQRRNYYGENFALIIWLDNKVKIK